KGELNVNPIADPPLYAEFVVIQPARRTLSTQARLFLERFEAEVANIHRIWEQAIGAERTVGAQSGCQQSLGELTMPNRDINLTRDHRKLKRLRAELKAGADALERGDFVEIDEADLE